MTCDFVPQPGRLLRSLAAGLLCAATCSPLFAANKLMLCFENKAVLPWRSVELEGLNFAMLKRVETKLDLTFDYALLPWKRCLAKLKANEVDGAFTVSFSDERRQYGAFPGNEQADVKRRMHYARYFMIRKKGSAIDWDGKRFLNVDGKIAFQLGYSVGEMLNAQKVPVDETNDTTYNVGRKVVAGRVAGAAMMDSDVTELMRGPLAAQLEVVPAPLVEKAYYLMLSSALVKARPELAEKIWKSIEEVRNGREYGKLIQAAGAENAR
ncbi:MAG: transporter substrate-binding domain-containing protein [Pseudomonadota bacterium]